MSAKRRTILISELAILGCAAFLYLSGALGQLLNNYVLRMKADGISGQAMMQPVSSPEYHKPV